MVLLLILEYSRLFFHSSYRFLSLAHSFTRTCWSSLFPNFFFLFRSSSQSFLPSFCPLSQSPSHVSEDFVRVVFAREREKKRSSTLPLPPPIFRTGISRIPRRRTATSLLAFTSDMSYHSKFASKNTHRHCKLDGPR